MSEMNEVLQSIKEKGDIGRRFTRRNPNGSYRIPIDNGCGLRIESDRYGCTLYGDIVNALGYFEERTAGMSAEEIEQLFRSRCKK